MNLDERKLSYQARQKMPKGEFVFPKEKRYPIHDKPHARNALARVSAHGTPSEKAKVRAAVHSKYPDIGECQVPPLGPKELAELNEDAGCFAIQYVTPKSSFYWWSHEGGWTDVDAEAALFSEREARMKLDLILKRHPEIGERAGLVPK